MAPLVNIKKKEICSFNLMNVQGKIGLCKIFPKKYKELNIEYLSVVEVIV